MCPQGGDGRGWGAECSLQGFTGRSLPLDVRKDKGFQHTHPWMCLAGMLQENLRFLLRMQRNLPCKRRQPPRGDVALYGEMWGTAGNGSWKVEEHQLEVPQPLGGAQGPLALGTPHFALLPKAEPLARVVARGRCWARRGSGRYF